MEAARRPRVSRHRQRLQARGRFGFPRVSIGRRFRCVVQVTRRTAAFRSRLQTRSVARRKPDRLLHHLRKGLLAMTRRQMAGLIVILTMTVSVAAETIDRVLSVVAGQVIMLSDVVAVRDLGIVPSSAGGDPIGSVLSKV